MANRFLREPITGGDDGSWAPYLLALTEAGGIGALTAYLYNDGGALKLSAGRIGINDGTNKGVCEMDTVQTISLAGVSDSTWAKIEVSVSGTAVTVAATEILGATRPGRITNLVSSYNAEKGGVYITATKRCIGYAMPYKLITPPLYNKVINAIANSRKVKNYFLNVSGETENNVYLDLVYFIPNYGDSIGISGIAESVIGGNENLYSFSSMSHLEYLGTDAVILYGIKTDVDGNTIDAVQVPFRTGSANVQLTSVLNLTIGD